MICPNCGNQIEEGSLFCAHCFTEIKIVPTYDSKVEQAVSEVMEDVGKRVERETNRQKSRSERDQQVARLRRRVGLILCGVIAGVAVMAMLFLFAATRSRNNESYYVARAYEKASSGDYDGAVQEIDEALARKRSTSGGTQLLLTKSEYEARAGKDDEAIGTLREIIDAAMDSSEVLSAYGRIIEIYSARGEYATIARMLRDSGDSEVQSSFRQYMVYQPQFTPASGSYEGDLDVTLSVEGDGSIFYTLDGSRPSTASSLYSGPISLTPGMTRVTAIYINRYGVVSRAVSRLYDVIGDAVLTDAPVVMPEGGTYSEEIRVTVDVPDNLECYYTTDGTDPTEDSMRYENPIPVPVGTTDYKFVLIGDDGIPGEITEVIYTRTETEKVTEADGPAIIIQSLIGLGEPMLSDGTVENGLARFVYAAQGRQTFYGKDYYTYVELMQDTAGNSVHTGRSFAVDVTDGTANYIDENANIVPIG